MFLCSFFVIKLHVTSSFQKLRSLLLEFFHEVVPCRSSIWNQGDHYYCRQIADGSKSKPIISRRNSCYLILAFCLQCKVKKSTTYAECLKRHKVAVHGTQGIYRKWDVLYVQLLTEDLVQNEAGVAFFLHQVHLCCTLSIFLHG